MAQQKTITLDEISRGIDKGLNTVDQQRAAALERLQLVRQVKATSLQREQTRLAIKYGEDHPRVSALTNRIALNQGLIENLVAETARAKTEIPTVDENTWVLHGYVRDEDRQGVPSLTVALYDQNSEWVRELGYGCTAENGYFKLDSTSSLVNKGVRVQLRVLNGRSEVLYADKNPLTPSPGQVDYREIVLTEEPQVCTPPDVGQTEHPGSPDTWIVRGRVTDASGRGVGGVIVNVYDKDLIFDDRLGQTGTDENGAYSLTYRTEDFRDLIEKKPDIYLKVMDQKGETLYSSKAAIGYEAGHVEVINVEISRHPGK